MIGSACTECVLPIISVPACSRARRASRATSSSSAAPMARPAVRHWIASAVSTTSLLVSPKWSQRPSGPTDSATWLTNAITSWSVVSSSSAIRFTSTRPRDRTAATAECGTTSRAASASRTASSTSSIASKRAPSLQTAAISGSV